jgi:hypothetical protein
MTTPTEQAGPQTVDLFPIQLVATGDKLSIKSSQGRWIFRKVVNRMSIEDYNRLHDDLARIVASANSGETLLGRISKLESYLEKTADGMLVCEAERLYCPKCGGEVRSEYDLAYCDSCVNKDGGAWPYEPPLPLSYSMCLASPKQPEAAKS